VLFAEQRRCNEVEGAPGLVVDDLPGFAAIGGDVVGEVEGVADIRDVLWCDLPAPGPRFVLSHSNIDHASDRGRCQNRENRAAAREIIPLA
jgi:hypothetical protein